MDIVIGHANGHGIREQEFLRSAAISAGIVASEKALRHIRFVSEAEAWVRFCLHHVDLESPLPVSEVWGLLTVHWHWVSNIVR